MAGIDANQWQRFLDAIAGINAAPAAGIKPPKLLSSDPEHFLIWKRNFADVANLNGWNAARAKTVARSCLEGEAAVLCHSIPLGDDGFTLQQLLDAYENRIISPAASAISETMFESAIQNTGESVNKYHQRLRTLFLRAFPDQLAGLDNNRQLIQRFLSGLSESQVRIYAKSQHPETYTACLAVSQQMEAVLLSEVKPRRGGIHSVGASTSNAQVAAIAPRTGSSSSSSKNCQYCQKVNHETRDCFALGKVQKLLENVSLSETALNGRGAKWNNKKKKGKNNNNNFSPRVAAVAAEGQTTGTEGELESEN